MNDTLRRYDTMSHEELLEELKSVKSQHETMSRRQETLVQELHEARKNNRCAAELREHLAAELETLQENEARLRRDHERGMQSLRDQFDAFKQQKWTEAEAANAKMEALQMKIRSLEQEAEAVDDRTDRVAVPSGDVTRLGDDLRKLEEENVELKDALAERKSHLVECDRMIVALRSQVASLDEQVHSLRCNLDAKKEELASVTDMLHSAQDDLCGVNAELQQFKNAANPHAVKGNSLFAEVDDKRQEMLKSLSQMKEKVHQLNRELLSKQAEVDSLLCEKKTIWEEYAGQAKQHDASLNRAYERRITDLEKQNDQLQREIARWYEKNLDTSASEITQWVSGVLDYYREENHRLSNEFAASSVDNLRIEQKLRDMQRQLVAWRTKAVEANAVISKLETKVQSIENTKPTLRQECSLSDKLLDVSTKKKNTSVIERNILGEKENFSPEGVIKISPINEIRKDSKPGILVTEPIKNKTAKRTTFQ